MKKFYGLHKLKYILRHYQTSTKPYFITTPIFYVNAAPHIGHLQSCLYADVFHRIQYLLGQNSILSTGTDEHGLKIQRAAEAAGKDTLIFCTEVSNQFKDVFTKANIAYSHFIRTTDEKHKTAVQHFWMKLKERGHIYKGKYEGWYSVSDETFVTPKQIKEVKDRTGVKLVCADTGQVLEKMQEENYIFALSKLKTELLHWLSKDVIKPKIFAKDVDRLIHESLEDLSISRQRSRLQWGIPVPDDETQTIYVWLDALINYLTVSGFPENETVWPPDCQVIGKDILKFHAVYWPAFLIAAGMEPPSSIFCHSHWTVNHEKMSKSKGNVIDPTELIDQYGCDGFRYFLLRSALPDSDANFYKERIFRILNAELADTLGNLLSRCCAPTINKRQSFPPFSQAAFDSIVNDDVNALIETARSLPCVVKQHFQKADFVHGVDDIMNCIRKANGFVQAQKPWILVKSNSTEDMAKVDIILHIALEVLRISGILLQPIIPAMAKGLLDKLGLPENERGWTNLECFSSVYNKHLMKERSLSEHNCILFERRKAAN